MRRPRAATPLPLPTEKNTLKKYSQIISNITREKAERGGCDAVKWCSVAGGGTGQGGRGVAAVHSHQGKHGAGTTTDYATRLTNDDSQ